ncbi:SDR family oxidoreductase [Diaminobutyricibacter tongyongensis]|uniref:SDR family oxidoreductase n=1 Tax=Leifsonia tongyongensis TaxID=1268043 RepID=A0A6L9Y1G7_9MICO|nr:SDR family oxidoreductase [Diaminobutyricibacter tongyongensis]NEN07098.1 SDR family oxidoreductase [Diaminobutyricibacter tongyongensis]
MTDPDLPLLGRAAIVTGVSRRRGIGFAIAHRLAELGADLFVHHFAPHDSELPWGADDLGAVFTALRDAQPSGARFGELSADLAVADSAAAVITAAIEDVGTPRILVCNHARSGGDGSIFDMTAERLDAHWSVNTRATLLLTRYFAEAFSGSPVDGSAPPATAPGVRQRTDGPFDEHQTGRVFWMTSGQQDGPMPGEVAYAASKAALAGLTPTVASELLTRGILLNTINPGPVNTGYLDEETTDRPLDEIQERMRSLPLGRFGLPDDPARLIGWLATDEGRWVVGQVITSDGGFRL